ncbi:MAG: heparan-alpha-glucosaminide N-acetyltransferase domain-containing protein [Candidatus Heimdallarchaeota archaeon]
MSQRIKSVDAFRGLSIVVMIFYHPVLWWTVTSQIWLLLLVRRILFLEASLFVFVSGISVVLSLRNRMEKIDINQTYSKRDIRREHYSRSLIFLIIAIIYNIFTVIWFMGLWGLWSWYVLFTVAICQLIAYPLMKLSSLTRVLLTFFIIFITYPILMVLGNLRNFSPKSGWSILYHLIFNPIQEYPILPNLAFFCLGTVCGEIFYETYAINDDILRNIEIKNKIVKKFFVYGTLLMVGALIYSSFMFNDVFTYLNRDTPICQLFGIGWGLFLIAFFTYIHDFRLSPEWKHKFFFYFSFYSLTLYLAHNIVAFIFWQSLNIIMSFIIATISTIGFWYLSKIMHNRFGQKASIKYLMGKILNKFSK